jgi:hypothetical protein
MGERWPPHPPILPEVWQGKDFKSFVLEVWQRKDLRAGFAEVWQGKDLGEKYEWRVSSSGLEVGGEEEGKSTAETAELSRGRGSGQRFRGEEESRKNRADW